MLKPTIQPVNYDFQNVKKPELKLKLLAEIKNLPEKTSGKSMKLQFIGGMRVGGFSREKSPPHPQNPKPI